MKKLLSSGGVLVFLGAFFWSLNAPIVKFLNVDSFLLCGLRSLIAGISLVAFIRPKKLNWNRWMIVYVLSYAALCLTVIVSLDMTSSPVAVGMQYTAPVWLFLVSVLKSKRFCFRSFLPVLVISVGVVFFMFSSTDDTSSKGNLIALTEGIFFAFLSTSSKKAAGTNPLGLTAIGSLFTGVLMLLLFPSHTATMVTMTTQDWIFTLILGVVQIGLGYAFFNLGVQKVSAEKASVISLWEMILGPVWAMLFLKEYISLPVIVGFVIILIGMLLDAYLSSHREHKIA